ncbi:hypothetical protein SAMN05518672_101452 [Chitinophaga sp. CF118]|uniref:hypothetical protein n=1 Tax=Chitinophaga sp. CF118 TaxID=1884367 RepID=UPI0008DFC574|nr:hypothetical protein [Chitinophaga sp. CF118]SFD09661.1 hypothetical protein SAMN05518672_101452 [Chitinophaga sp. CF118]
MKPTPQQHCLRLNHLGIGDIQLGKRPEQLPDMLPFDHFVGKHTFDVMPAASLYHVFDGDLRCTIESQDTGIVLSHLFAATNENGFINRIFLYTREVNGHLAERLSQLYGEPNVSKATVAGKLIGTHNSWITEGETEVSFFSPVYDTTTSTVISFRFFYDFPALKDYMISVTL